MKPRGRPRLPKIEIVTTPRQNECWIASGGEQPSRRRGTCGTRLRCRRVASNPVPGRRIGPAGTGGGSGGRVSLDQKRARVFGVLYLVTFVTSIPALVLYEPALRHPVAFVAGSGNFNEIYLGALLELLLIIANIGTAVVIVPIMRRQFEELSIGYVTARLVECTFILVGIVAMLGIATLQQENAGAAEGTVAYTLAAIKDWTFLLGPGWLVGWGNGLILGYMMYRTGLVPRRVTWLGLIGGPLIIISGTVVMFGGDHGAGRVPGPRDDPRGLVGTLPRHLLHHLGFQARCPDPFRERGLSTSDVRNGSLGQRPGMSLEAGAGSSAAGPRPARRHPGGVTVDPGVGRAPQEREARPTGLLRSLEVGSACAGSVTCLARRPLGVRGLNDAVEWPLIHVIQAVEGANRIGIRERSGLPAGCRARHTRRPRRTSDFTCESGPTAQACEGKRTNHRAEHLPHVLLPPVVVSAERAANCRTWRLTGNATRLAP